MQLRELVANSPAMEFLRYALGKDHDDDDAAKTEPFESDLDEAEE